MKILKWIRCPLRSVQNEWKFPSWKITKRIRRRLFIDAVDHIHFCLRNTGNDKFKDIYEKLNGKTGVKLDSDEFTKLISVYLSRKSREEVYALNKEFQSFGSCFSNACSKLLSSNWKRFTGWSEISKESYDKHLETLYSLKSSTQSPEFAPQVPEPPRG